jgi:hypothetical protein
VTIVPRSIADHGVGHGTSLAIVDIAPPITRRHTALAWRTHREQPPAAQAFLTTARRWAAQGGRARGLSPGVPKSAVTGDDADSSMVTDDGGGGGAGAAGRA